MCFVHTAKTSMRSEKSFLRIVPSNAKWAQLRLAQDVRYRAAIADVALPAQQVTALRQPAFQRLAAAVIVLVVEMTVGAGFFGHGWVG